LYRCCGPHIPARAQDQGAQRKIDDYKVRACGVVLLCCRADVLLCYCAVSRLSCRCRSPVLPAPRILLHNLGIFAMIRPSTVNTLTTLSYPNYNTLYQNLLTQAGSVSWQGLDRDSVAIAIIATTRECVHWACRNSSHNSIKTEYSLSTVAWFLWHILISHERLNPKEEEVLI
jgi:hypothetical protein